MPPVESDLERMIADDPFDEARWLVFEDWLLEQPDPRAEIIRCAKANAGETEARFAALPVLLGERHAELSRALVNPVWRAGHVVECRFLPPVRPDLLFGAFLAAPAARLVRGLALRGTNRQLTKMLAALSRAPCARSLRALELLGQDSTTALLPSEWLAGLSLRRLSIPAGTVRFEDLSDLTTLEHVELAAASLSELDLLARGPLPKLDSMKLRLAAADYLARGDRNRAGWLDRLGQVIEGIAAFAPALSRLDIELSYRDAIACAREAAGKLGLQSLTVSPSGAS